MRIQKAARLIAITLSLLMAACNALPSTSAPSTPMAPTVQIVTLTGPITGAPATVNAVSPLPTPTAYASSGITISVDLASFSGAPVFLARNQKLVVIPPLQWGSLGWNVAFDEQFLQLDSQIDPVHPPATGWIWTPKRVGQTQITISSVPDPCTKANPPCAIPTFGVTLNIKIID
jgi:hypothetical protein